MGTIDIDYTSLGVGLLLLLIPVYFLWRFKTGLLKPILIGAVRMIIQLFFIGVYLRFLFEWNNPFINFYFRKKHFGIINAINYFIFLHIINILPDSIVCFIWKDTYIDK